MSVLPTEPLTRDVVPPDTEYSRRVGSGGTLRTSVTRSRVYCFDSGVSSVLNGSQYFGFRFPYPTRYRLESSSLGRPHTGPVHDRPSTATSGLLRTAPSPDRLHWDSRDLPLRRSRRPESRFGKGSPVYDPTRVLNLLPHSPGRLRVLPSPVGSRSGGRGPEDGVRTSRILERRPF